MKSTNIVPVILCGGTGSRLWPLSRQTFPKQFLTLNFTNGYSLLQKTQKRIRKIQNIQDPILICNEEHRFIVAEQMRKLQVKPNAIILEPFGRNTAPAIAVAAIKALEIYDDPNLLILSADHKIDNEDKFSEVIEKGLEYSKNNNIVTFGITPTSPEVGYGYIKSEEAFNKLKIEASKIDCFVEKPNKNNAKMFFNDKRYLWNSGIFMFKASLILRELNKFSPDLVRNCNSSLNKRLFDLDFQRLDRDSFAACPNVSIDVAVMEKTKNAYVLPLNVGWSDVGSWDFVWKISTKNSDGNVIEGDVIEKNTEDSFLYSQHRLVAAIGIKNMIVVETRDAILIADKDQSQEVKDIVHILNEKKKPQGFEHHKCFRPWGTYESLVKENRWQVKLIEVKPGESLSLQRHKFRSEHWVVVSGIAKVEIDETEIIFKENQSTYIPVGSKHRLSNPGSNILKIVEIQSGSYLGEDDIERFDDNYGRISKA